MSTEKESVRRIATTESLARYLGISRWTVSRVLNGHPGVKAETVERVKRAMADLDFAPNPIARGLRGGQTRLVGVCFQELETAILVRKTVAIQRALREADYQAIIELTLGSPELEQRVMQSFQALKVDGIILVGSSLRADGEVLRGLEEAGIPVVVMDPAGPVALPQVSLDRERAYFLLTQHLLERIRGGLAVLGIDDTVIYGKERLRGVAGAARVAGRKPEDVLYLSERGRKDLFYEYGFDLGARLLVEARALPAGILCLNDEIALGVLRRLGEEGIEAPRDVRVAGYDNLDVSRYARPTLTTVDQQIPRLTELTLHLLLSWMENGTPPRKRRYRVAPELLVRESTGGTV